jgi:hypothetical protein
MKLRNRIFNLLVIALTAVTSVSFAHGNEAFNDDYKISPKEDLIPGTAFRKSWEITYGESGRPVQVLLKETKSGEEYIIRTNYFEVKYVNSEKGFGVRELKPAEQIVPADLNMKVLNVSMMNNQKVISPTRVTDNEVLDLIAGYLPELINAEYRSILN